MATFSIFDLPDGRVLEVLLTDRETDFCRMIARRNHNHEKLEVEERNTLNFLMEDNVCEIKAVRTFLIGPTCTERLNFPHANLRFPMEDFTYSEIMITMEALGAFDG